jgi:hypothetical protein
VLIAVLLTVVGGNEVVRLDVVSSKVGMLEVLLKQYLWEERPAICYTSGGSCARQKRQLTPKTTHILDSTSFGSFSLSQKMTFWASFMMLEDVADVRIALAGQTTSHRFAVGVVGREAILNVPTPSIRKLTKVVLFRTDFVRKPEVSNEILRKRITFRYKCF